MIWPPIAFVLAMTPGVLAWWSGRRIIALRDDPLLPERLLERTRRLAQAGIVIAVFLMFVLPAQAPWALPVGAVALAIGSFPARRVLRDETWGLARYLVALARFQLAAGGIWVLVAAAPLLVLAAGPNRWPVAAGLSALLLAWSAVYAWLFLRLVGAQPLERADLEPRFAAVVARASVAPPRIYRFGFRGGHVTNAFALPAGRQSTILFGDQVLALLEPDELAAIFAHEVAHLEHWGPARHRRSQLAMVAVVALAVAGVPLLQFWLPAWASLLGWGWVLALLLALGARMSYQRRHEAESDRRAADLCADPEALARGLTKLNALARLPRRWAADFEGSASHPSLARRIQAIRAAAGTAAARLATATAFLTEQPGLVVLLEPDRVTWLEGVPDGTPLEPAAARDSAASIRSVRYGELVELRVRPGLIRGPSLVARARSGRSWSVPIGAADVRAAQAALDVVDAQLGQESAPRGATLILARALAACVVTLGALCSAFAATAVAAVVALVMPGRAALAALGTAVLASGLVGLWSVETFAGVSTFWASIALAALAVPALGLARAAGPEPRLREGIVALMDAGALSVVGFAAGVGALLGGVEPADLAALPWTAPTACVGLVAAAAALATIPRPAFRRVAGGLALLALAPVVLAIGARVAGPRPVLALRDGTANLISRADVGTVAGTLRMAPSANRFAVTLVAPGRVASPLAFHVGDFTGVQHLLPALDVAFLDDRRLLVLVRQELGLELQLVAADTGDPVWRAPLPELEVPRLTALGADGWLVVGTESGSESTVAASGRAGSGPVTVKRWAPDGDADTDRAFLAADALYRVTVRPAPWAVSRWAAVWMLLVPTSDVVHTRLARLGPDGWRTVATWRRPVRCEAVSDGRVVCLAPLAAGTRVSVLEPSAAQIMALGEIPGPVWRWSVGATGDIGMITSDGRGALLDIVSRRITRFTLATDAGGAVEALPLPGRLAVLARSRGGSTVSVYEVRGPGGRSGTGLRPSESSPVSQPR